MDVFTQRAIASAAARRSDRSGSRLAAWRASSRAEGSPRSARAPASSSHASARAGRRRRTACSARYFEEDLVEPPVVVSPAGTIDVPEGPGIGHEIVWPRVEKATTFREEWKP